MNAPDGYPDNIHDYSSDPRSPLYIEPYCVRLKFACNDCDDCNKINSECVCSEQKLIMNFLEDEEAGEINQKQASILTGCNQLNDNDKRVKTIINYMVNKQLIYMPEPGLWRVRNFR